MNLLKRIEWQKDLLHQQGVCTYFKGLIRRLYYKKLQREYCFESWHIMPYELRPYAWNLVQYINECGSFRNGALVEIGCGIGDLIRNIRAEEKYAFDISSAAIKCAISLDNDKNVSYYVGSFGDVAEKCTSKIDLLLTVNFIHNINSEVLKEEYEKILNCKFCLNGVRVSV